MKLFNARLDIQSAAPVSTGLWSLIANIVDNDPYTGGYSGSDVQIGDVIHAYGSDINSQISLCRYQVSEIVSVSGQTIEAKIIWDQPDINDAADPLSLDMGFEAIIGRPLPNGMSAISGTGNGISSDIVTKAANINTQIANLTSYNMAPQTLTSVNGVITLPNTINKSHIYLVNGLEDITQITGWTDGKVILVWNFARNIIASPGILEPNLGQSRLLGQGEICTYIFVNGCCKESCSSGGFYTIDGGVF